MPRLFSVICSRNAGDPQFLAMKESFGAAGHTNLTLVEGAESIFAGYQMGAESAATQMEPDDIFLFHHDDIELFTADFDLTQALSILESRSVGFVGVAGTRRLDAHAVWWKPADPFGRGHTFLSGEIHHRTAKGLSVSAYGEFCRVVALDGVFLGCTLRTYRAASPFERPASFPGPWDFYDVLACLRTHQMGLKNYAVDFPLIHNSAGRVDARPSWQLNRAAFAEMFAQNLPIEVDKEPTPTM